MQTITLLREKKKKIPQNPSSFCGLIQDIYVRSRKETARLPVDIFYDKFHE